MRAVHFLHGVGGGPKNHVSGEGGGGGGAGESRGVIVPCLQGLVLRSL